MYGKVNGFTELAPFIILIPVVIFGIVILYFILTALKQTSGLNPKDRASGKSIQARVIGKRIREMIDPNAYYSGDTSCKPTRFYYVSVEGRNFERMELSVTSDVYNTVAEGTEGTLTYQGMSFVDFIPGEW